jgi:hypothetical protein
MCKFNVFIHDYQSFEKPASRFSQILQSDFSWHTTLESAFGGGHKISSHILKTAELSANCCFNQPPAQRKLSWPTEMYTGKYNMKLPTEP